MSANDVHRITRDQMEHVFKCLWFIDRARKALAAKGPGNEAIVTELERSAGGIHHVINELPRIEEGD